MNYSPSLFAWVATQSFLRSVPGKKIKNSEPTGTVSRYDGSRSIEGLFRPNCITGRIEKGALSGHGPMDKKHRTYEGQVQASGGTGTSSSHARKDTGPEILICAITACLSCASLAPAVPTCRLAHFLITLITPCQITGIQTGFFFLNALNVKDSAKRKQGISAAHLNDSHRTNVNQLFKKRYLLQPLRKKFLKKNNTPLKLDTELNRVSGQDNYRDRLHEFAAVSP